MTKRSATILVRVPGRANKTDALRVGLVPLTSEWGGGVFQYSQTMLSVLADLREVRDEEFVLLADGLSDADPLLNGASWEIAALNPPSPTSRILPHVKNIARSRLPSRLREHLSPLALRLERRGEVPSEPGPHRRPDVRSWFEGLGIDLVLYPASMPLSFEAGTPYVLAVHDLQHRLQPEFPEVSAGQEFALREYVFRNGIREATVVLTDSEVGREDVLNLYGDLIAPERVAVLPFLPAVADLVSLDDRERVSRKYRLPERFLFYPAQMWPHKNHLRLVEALAELERSDGIEIEIVLIGSKSGEIRERTHAELLSRVRALGLQDRVHYFGYVPAGDVGALYAEAVALVMPTFFGPTNIPVLEAWALNCPVVTSDIRGVREQVGDAALLADPRSVGAIADAIRKVWLDAELRDELIRRGRSRLSLYTREDYSQRLSEILDQAGELVRGARERAHV